MTFADPSPPCETQICLSSDFAFTTGACYVFNRYEPCLAVDARSASYWKALKNKRHELKLRKGRRPVYTKPKGYSTKKPVRNTVRFNRK